MDIRTKEAVRYLGYGKTAVDEKTLLMIRESFAVLERISEPKCVYRIFELSEMDDELQICNLRIKSKSLQKNLKGCEQVVLFGATLGTAVDRQIRTYELTDMARAVVMQACATAITEEYCDEIQEQIAQKLAEGHLYLRPRFSPGYGDFSMLHQREILSMLDASKRIGLAMTEGYMLTPTKSVTALIGVSNTKAPCHRKGCEECTKADCVYRRSQECYGKS